MSACGGMQGTSSSGKQCVLQRQAGPARMTGLPAGLSGCLKASAPPCSQVERLTSLLSLAGISEHQHG